MAVTQNAFFPAIGLAARLAGPDQVRLTAGRPDVTLAVMRAFFGMLLLLGLSGPSGLALAAGAAGAEDEAGLLVSCGLTPDARVMVESVIDGDTVLLADGRQVRLVGIQAPKLPLGREGMKAWPLAAQMRGRLATRLTGQPVRLYVGTAQQDRHGRLLAHLLDPEGRWVQGRLLQEGAARVYTFPDNRLCAGEMLARESVARAARTGIWGDAYYVPRPADPPQTLSDLVGTFQLVEGVVRSVGQPYGRLFLNFGEDWTRDFTVMVGPDDVNAFDPVPAAWGVPSIEALVGRRVRVRGWIDRYNGPMIKTTHPEQIEVLGR